MAGTKKNFSLCLWFDTQGEEAAKLYTSVFKNSKILNTARYTKAAAQATGQKEGSAMTVNFQLEDLEILALNGGPAFKHTPALSLFVTCDNDKDIQEKWAKLSPGGKARFGLDKYPWAEKYGWTSDRFGVEWQLILSPRKEKIVPAFLFVDRLFGKGEEALNFYTSVFPKSKIERMVHDPATNTVMHASFTLNGQGFVLMEGKGDHGFTFNEGTSIVVHCDTQKEIDAFWSKLTGSGGSESQCGWLKDQFGVSWQIVPTRLGEWLSNPKTSGDVMAALLKMRKLDIEKLKQAAK